MRFLQYQRTRHDARGVTARPPFSLTNQRVRPQISVSQRRRDAYQPGLLGAQSAGRDETLGNRECRAQLSAAEKEAGSASQPPAA